MKMQPTIIIIFFVYCTIISACSSSDKKTTDEEYNDMDSNNLEELKWSDLSEKSYTLSEALNYCVKIGGRIPNIDELRTLIKDCQATETNGECQISVINNEDSFYTGSCLGCEITSSGKYSVFSDSNQLWSSTELDVPTLFSLKSPFGESGAWSVKFDNAEIAFLEGSNKAFVRCLPCNKGDKRILTCDADNKKLQEQTCDEKGNFVNDRDCVDCIYGNIQTIECEANNEKFQDQKCNESGSWSNSGECYECFESNKRETTCESDPNMFQTQYCANKFWENLGGCFKKCPENDPFCLENGELLWSGKSVDFFSDANEYCKNIGGRLPNIDELRTLIINCPGTETGGECTVTQGCLSHSCENSACSQCEENTSGKYSVFGDYESFWSDSINSSDTSLSWSVSFTNGSIYDFNYTGIDEDPAQYFRCVKQSQ